MPGRRTEDVEPGQARVLPPIELRHALDAELPQPRSDSTWCAPLRRRMVRRQPSHAAAIEMVVMIVRQQDQVDRWKGGQCDTWWDPPSGTGEPNGRRTIPPHRIGEDIDRADLKKEG